MKWRRRAPKDSGTESDELDRLLTPPPATPVGLSTDELIAEGQQLAEELCESFPNQPEVLSASGRILFTIGRSSDALARWEQALQISDRSGEAWLGMAESAWEQGDFGQAVERMSPVGRSGCEVGDSEVVYSG